MADIDLETKVINKFVLKSKRDRYIGIIQKENTRSKFIEELSHGQIFHDDLFENIHGPEGDLIMAVVKNVHSGPC